MSETDLTEAPPAPWGNEVEPLDIQPDAPGDTGSYADKVRARHREFKQKKHHLDLRIPGPAGIVVRYRPVTSKRAEALSKRKADPEYGTECTFAMDLLLAGCDRVFIHAPGQPGADKDGLVPFERMFGLGDDVIKLSSPELAEALGETASTAREIVFAVFPTTGAIVSDHRRLNVWSADVTAEVSEEILGE